MQRLFFYGMIILVIVLLIALIDVILYWMMRIFLPKPVAQITNGCFLAVMVLTIGISCWWGHNRTRLQVWVNQVKIESNRLPEAFEGFRIAQLSDMHLGSFEPEVGHEFLSQLIDTLTAQQPNVIVFTGDLVTIRAAESYIYRDELTRLGHIQRANGEGVIPVYSILGNHDYADYMRNYDEDRRKQDLDSLIDIQTKAGWQILKNDMSLLTRLHNDTIKQQIAIVGVENIGEPPFSVYGDLDRAMEPIGGKAGADSIFTVLLSHNPTHWRREVLPETHIDLMLAGHTHATQVKVGTWSPAKWKYDEWMGLYEENGQRLYVNTGIGTVGPAVRVGIEPEVTILELKKSSE